MSINNTDELIVVLTSYGLGRVSQCLSDQNENINMTKMKFGRGEYNSTTEDFDYYEPSATQTELKSLITTQEFPLIDKALLEDEITVSFHSAIPETFSGYDIREVGLYETVNGIDYLFAIGTYQPIVKPSAEYNYFMTIDFYMFLKSVNLANIYDQIIIDPGTKLVSETELEQLMRTILFVEGNLETQIEGNSVELGYNRASQLHDKIAVNERDYSYYTIYSNYADLTNIIGVEKIFSNWVFNYPRRSSSTNAIVDIGPNQFNLNTNKPVNQYARSYEGIAAMLDFTGTNYFNLPVNIDSNNNPLTELSLLNLSKTEDISFSMIFVVNPKDHNSDLTLLARSNYNVGINVFEITEKVNRSLQIKLFSDASNYITYTSAASSIPNESHALVFSYDKDSKAITAYVNGKKLTLTKTTTGTYTHMNSNNSTIYAYVATISGVDQVIYADRIYSGTLYGWTYQGNTVYTKTLTLAASTPLFNADGTSYTGSAFAIALPTGTTTYVVQYLGNNTSRGYDVYNKPNQLYNANGTLYEGTDWVIGSSTITYKGTTATYTASKDKTFPLVGLTSYLTDANNNYYNYINSYINVISVLLTDLTEAELRAVSLTLVSTLGKNPCMLLGE